MKTIMKLEDLATINQLPDFLSGTQAVAFLGISDKDACYHLIQGKVLVIRYLIPFGARCRSAATPVSSSHS